MKYGKSMNERIKELAEQAKMFATPMKFHLGGQDYARVRDEKFAELIVQECCRALNPMLRDMISRGQAVELIQKHFGVEQ